MATIELKHTQKYYHLIASDLMQKDYWLRKRDDENFNFGENFEKLNPHSKLFVEGVHYKEL